MDRKYFQSGFDILEVLIALAIISLGVMGYIKMQVLALQASSDAGLRTTAVILAQDMVGRIQANSADAMQGTASGYRAGAACNNQCHASNGPVCNPTEMAQNDLCEWQALVTSALPGSLPLVCLDAIPGNTATTCTGGSPNPVVFTVKIFWTSRNSSKQYDQHVIATAAPHIQKYTSGSQ